MKIEETAKKAGKLPGAFKKCLLPFGRLGGHRSCGRHCHRLAFLFFYSSSFILHPSSLLYAANLFPGYGSAISAASADLDVSMPQVLVSTPGIPANGAYLNFAKPAFLWVGVSTVTAARLAGAGYTLQVDNNIDFSSPEVVLSTPVIINSTNAVTTTGFIQLSTHTLSDATTYYWRVFTQGNGGSGPYSSTAGFVTDLTPPAFSGFAVKSSTGGWLGESKWTNLPNGVTAQATVQDPGSGLDISAAGFSVKYSSNGGVNWVTDAGWTDADSGNPVIAGETSINSFAVYNGKLYAGTSGGKAAVFDEPGWTPINGGVALIDGETQVLSLAVYDNKLYAGTSPNGKVAVFDGTNWSAANGGNPVISGETQILSLAVYNGRLYAGTGGNGKVAVFDGTNWSAANGGNPVITGETQINSLAVHNGQLYAATSPNGKAAVFDGTNWGAANGGNPVISGETQVLSLAVYNGGLYAGTSGVARVAKMSPLNTSLPGPDGGTSAQLLTANGALNFGQSPGLIICNGSAPCSARNQVLFNAADLAGNAIVYGPYAVAVDTTPPPVPVMSAPSDGAAYRASTVPFSWSAASDLLSGPAGFELQLSTAADFTPVNYSSFTVNLSTSAGNLSEGLQYWRVRSKDNAGNYSAYASTRAFYVDLSSPVVTNNQASPTPWYTADPGAVFNVDFTDLVGLTTAQYRVTSLAAGGGTVIKDWSNIYSNPAGATSFTTDWAVDFAALGEGLNFVSVRVFDRVALSSTVVDAFVIRKDAAPPYVINNQAGDNNWRNAAGTLYNADFADAGQGVASAQYMITSQPLGAGTLLKDWTDITAATSTALYSPDWGVDFPALVADAPNYVSVRAYDLTGKSTTYYDAFYVLKDVANPLIIDNQPDDIWRSADPGAIYNVDFTDAGGSKLNRAQYSMSSSAALGDGSVKGWTDIAVNINSNGYTQNWGVDFAGEHAGVNYVSVRVYDNAGNYAQQNDIFTVSKDNNYPVITDNQSGDDVWRASAGTLYNVDFADSLSGLATAQYRITAQPGQAGTVIKDWTDIYSNPAGVPAYTDDWPVDFAGLQEWTVNYVSVRAYNLAGRVVVSPDVFHVWKDTTPPSAALTGFSVDITTLSLSATGLDAGSGFKDYHFEVSSAEDFLSGVSSTNYTASNSAVFANMLEATTYYARATTRDNVYNESAYSVVLSTLTRGFVYVSSWSLAPANVLQGSDAVMMSVDLVTNAGRAASLQRIDLSRTGTASAADFTAVKIYRDNNLDGLVDVGDTLLGSAGFSGVNASINMTLPQTVNNTPVKLLVVYGFSAGATVGATAGVTIAAASKLVLAAPYQPVGVFPLGSTLATIQDGPNNLSITATSIAPGSVLPGTANVPVIKLAMNTNTGTSIINTLNVLLAGTVQSNNISAVKLYLDANGNAQFDLGDQLLSSGADTFLNYSSTITLTAAASARIVGTISKYMFVVVDVALDAPEASDFTVSIPTSAAFALNNPSDKPVMTPPAFTSGQVTVKTNNTANIYTVSLVPAEFVQGRLYAVALASASVNIGIAELNRVKVNRIGTSVDGDIAAVRVYKDQVLDGGDFNADFDLFVGSAAFAGSMATVDITTVTVTAGATTQLFVAYEISPTAIANNIAGAGFTNTGYFRMADVNTAVYGAFPYNTATASIRATVNPLKVTAAMDVSVGELFQGTTNNAILRLDLKSEFNPVNWTSLRVKSVGTLPDNMVNAVNLYRDVNGDGILTAGVDQLVTSGNDTFIGGEVNLYLTPPQSINSAGGSYFVSLDINADAAQGYTAGVEITTTAWVAVNAPSYISSACVSAPYRGGPVLVKQYPNIVTVSTANVVPSAGAYPDTANVPVFMLTLKTDISKAKFLAVKFSRSGTLTDAEVKAVKVYYDINNLGSFDSSNVATYPLVTASTVTFGTDGLPGQVTLGISTATGGLDILKIGRNFYVVVDLQPAVGVGHSMTMRVLDQSYFTVSGPNTVAPISFNSRPLYVRAAPQTLSVVFENKLSTSVTQGLDAVLAASFTVTASSYSIDMSRINFMRGGNGFDSDITAIKLYRDNGDGVWGGISVETLLAAGVFSDGLVSFAPAVQTIAYPNLYLYYLVVDIDEAAVLDRDFGVDLPGESYISVNGLNTVAVSPFYSQRAVIQPTVDTVIVSGLDGVSAKMQGDSNMVMGRLRMRAATGSALMYSIRFDKTGTTPDTDVTLVRVYKDTDANGTLNPAVDQLVGTLSSFSSGAGVMAVSPVENIGTAAADYFVTVDISTLAAINTSFNLQVTPSIVSPDVISITGSTITFTMAGGIIDKSDTVHVSFSDIASRSLYMGTTDNKIVKLSFSTDNDTAYLTGLKLNFTGSAGTTDIPLVKLYRDTDGSGYFDPAYDVLAASASMSAGEAYLYPAGAGDLITASTRTYFAVVDIAAGAGMDKTLSLGIMSGANNIYLAAPDLVYPFSSQATANSVIRDLRIPMPPAISIYKADGGLYSETSEAVNAYRTQLNFKWQATILQGSIGQVYYYIGPQPADDSTPALSWVAAGVGGEISVKGLNLLNNGIYYLSVKVKNSLGAYYSDITSKRFTVDTVVPSLPGALTVSTEGGELTLNWDAAIAGISGIEYYVVEQRRGNNPLWTAISSTTDCALPIITGVRTSAITPGSYFYRVYPVNNAGRAGPTSEPLSVNINLDQLATISDASFYPNPFYSSKGDGTFAFTLNANNAVAITIYDAFGWEVKSLNIAGAAGSNSVTWDGTGPSGKVSMGMYLCVIKAAGDSKVLKVGVNH